jgi:hypothetical protein
VNTVYLNASYVDESIKLKGQILVDKVLSGVIKLSDEQIKLNAKLHANQVLTGVVADGGNLNGIISIGGSDTNVAYPFYKGEYEVTPTRYNQSLDTSNKILTKDITIVEIPYAEVSNTSGGNTFYIARE